MPELKFIIKNANGRILFKDAGGNIIQDRPDYEAVGLTGELYPESITVGAGENTYSFVIPANGGITYTSVGGTPTTYTGNASGLLAILSANFFNASTGSGGGGGGGDASAANQNDQLARQGTTSDSPATNPNGTATQIALEKGIFGNGLKFKSFELVMEEGTGIEYYRAVDFDPTTPPTSTTYIDPNTGLVTTPPINPVHPVVSALGVGRVTDALELNSGANASLVSVSKGLLDFASQTNAAIGTGGDTPVLDPNLGGSAIALLKGIVSNTTPAPTASNHQRNSQTTNSVLVKSGAGKILSGAFTNKTTGTKYLRVYSINTTPAPTLVPLFELAALTGTTVPIPQINGFVLGIAYIISSSANQAGAQLTVADAASVQLSYI